MPTTLGPRLRPVSNRHHRYAGLAQPFGQSRWRDSAGVVTTKEVKRTVKPSRVGAQVNGPAAAVAAGSSGATRNSSHGPSSQRARIVRASPDRLTLMVTSRPAQAGTGA